MPFVDASACCTSNPHEKRPLLSLCPLRPSKSWGIASASMVLFTRSRSTARSAPCFPRGPSFLGGYANRPDALSLQQRESLTLAASGSDELRRCPGSLVLLTSDGSCGRLLLWLERTRKVEEGHVCTPTRVIKSRNLGRSVAPELVVRCPVCFREKSRLQRREGPGGIWRRGSGVSPPGEASLVVPCVRLEPQEAMGDGAPTSPRAASRRGQPSQPPAGGLAVDLAVSVLRFFPTAARHCSLI